MTAEVGREEDELAMLMLELRAWRYSGGGMVLAMGRDERRRWWVEEEEEEGGGEAASLEAMTDEARRLVPALEE